MLGKFTSLADWKLGQLLWDEPYDDDIAQRSQKAVENCVDYAEEIGHSSAEGIRRLMAGLIESGLCMLEFGSSRPASGAEHHCSHYLEMKLLQESRPAILHGAKVGFATILIAERYEKIKQLARRQVIKRLKTATIPDREQEIQRIKAAYGPLGNLVCEAQAPFLNLSKHDYGLLKQKIIDHWTDIQDIATKVPTSQQITDLLSKAGGPIEAKALGLNDEEVELALEYSHYLRNRFTVSKLGRMLQMT